LQIGDFSEWAPNFGTPQALRRREIALVTQEPGLVPHLTARENVELGLQVRGAGGSASQAAADALVQVGLAERLEHRADRLSAGERQRVAIARALASRPHILLADEPTARLDQANARAVGRLLARLAHEGDTVWVPKTQFPCKSAIRRRRSGSRTREVWAAAD